MKNHITIIIFVATILMAASCHRANSLQEVKSQYIETQNGKIHYKTYGKGSPAMVFVHGFGCDMNAWKAQFPYFAEKNQLVFIDLPGFGESEKPETDYTLDFYSEAVKEVLDKLDIQDVILIGHSLGTPVCRRVIQNYPELKAMLCDVDGVYCFYPDDSLAYQQYKAMIDGFTESFRDTENYQENMMGFINPLFTDATPDFVRDYATKTMMETPSYISYSTMKNLVDQKYWNKTAMTVPTLVFAAKASMIPDDYEQIMRLIYSDMEYNEWDTVGHFMMMEKPEKFNKILENFVKKH